MPQHLKLVATLPCEILMSVKLKQPEVYNVIYDILQGIVSTGFRSGEISDYDFIMAALRSICGHYIFVLWFLLFSSPNLSRQRLDVYHTSTHGVALVRI